MRSTQNVTVYTSREPVSQIGLAVRIPVSNLQNIYVLPTAVPIRLFISSFLLGNFFLFIFLGSFSSLVTVSNCLLRLSR